MAAGKPNCSEKNSAAPPEFFLLPLSYSQQRLWFVQQMDSASVAYNLPYRVRLIGELDIQALERSFQEIVRRHEVLRTCFPLIDGEPMQQIASWVDFHVQFVDVSGLPDLPRMIVAEELLGQEARFQFDLLRGPLIRGFLLRLEERVYDLLITTHHIVTDGWSVKILAGEFAVLYEACKEGRKSPLPELALQYGDYAVWQRKWLTGEVLQKQIDYWRQQLKGVATLALPIDRPRGTAMNYHGGNVRFQLGTELSQALLELARREGVTLFMLVLAVFQVLLGRYSGQEDVAVGSVIANRNRAEVEGLIGFFVNTLVLRTDLSGDPGFSELLARVREVTLGAYAHQDVPFEKLVEELSPERDMSISPLFQAMLILQNMPEGKLELSNLRLQPQDLELDIAKFDLSMALGESGIASEGIVGSCSYNSDLFDYQTAEDIVARFRELLAAVVQTPNARISSLPFKPPRQELLEVSESYLADLDDGSTFQFDLEMRT